MANKTLLITDLDNTLWDWFAAWYGPFSALLNRLQELSGVARPVLEREIRDVHQRRGTSEYSYLLNELPSLIISAGKAEPMVVYDDAIHVQNAARLVSTKLYSGVAQTLHLLRQHGVMIVAYTESVAYWTEWRIKHTGLDGVIEVLYSAPDHDLPAGVTFDSLRRWDASEYGLKLTDHRHVKKGTTKPNEEVLRAILADCSREAQEAVYVGDSLLKDIVMAQRGGVLDVHAKYGEVQHLPEYNLLQRVSHWPERDVTKERGLTTSGEVEAQVVLSSGFWEILDVFERKKEQG